MRHPLPTLMSVILAFSLTLTAQQSFGPFTEKTNSGIPVKNYTCAAFGDYNNDGFIDLALTESTVGGAKNELTTWRNNPANPGTSLPCTLFSGPIQECYFVNAGRNIEN